MNPKKHLLRALRPKPCRECGAQPDIVGYPWPKTCIDVMCPKGCICVAYLGTERDLAIKAWNETQKHKTNTCP